MGTGTGTGPRIWVAWVRVWVQVQDVKSRMKDCVGITIATQNCTWVPVPGYGFEILVKSHIVTRPCETIQPLFMLYVGILQLY